MFQFNSRFVYDVKIDSMQKDGFLQSVKTA